MLTAKALLDDIINVVNYLANTALDSVQDLLIKLPPKNLGFRSDPSAAKLEIENGTHQLETLLNASIDKNFDIFELYVMKNILTVKPEEQPYMVLSHYEGLDFKSDISPDGVNALRRKVQASQQLHVALKAECAKNEALLTKLRAAVVGDSPVKSEGGPSVLGFLNEKGGLEQGGTKRPIGLNTEFALSQLGALRGLSEELGELLPRLEEEQEEESKSWRRERAEYVEGAARKFLEREGVELGEMGEVRDGEWQGEGRGLTREEVEGLERVVERTED